MEKCVPYTVSSLFSFYYSNSELQNQNRTLTNIWPPSSVQSCAAPVWRRKKKKEMFPFLLTSSFLSLFVSIWQPCGEILATANWLGNSQTESPLTLSQEHQNANLGSWKQLPLSLCIWCKWKRVYWFQSKEQALLLCSWQELPCFWRCWVCW